MNQVKSRGAFLIYLVHPRDSLNIDIVTSYVSRRVTMHSILAILGADVLVGRMNRMRDDERIKVVIPDFLGSAVPDSRPASARSSLHADVRRRDGDLVRLGFVDFWKANNCESSRLEAASNLL